MWRRLLRHDTETCGERVHYNSVNLLTHAAPSRRWRADQCYHTNQRVLSARRG